MPPTLRQTYQLVLLAAGIAAAVPAAAVPAAAVPAAAVPAAAVPAAAVPAAAVIVDRKEVLMAAENCQAALPAYDGNIRKRPLAVQNEGTASAFVTCALKGAFAAAAINSRIGVRVINTTASPQSVACTLVDGRDLALSTPVFLARTAVLAASGSAELVWTAGSNGGNYIYPAMSCSLPPGTGIRSTSRTYRYEE